MKKWGLRILSAILTFTAGTCAALFFGRNLKPVLIQPVRVEPNINLQTPTMQIAETVQPTSETDEDAQSGDENYKPIKPHLVSISPYEIKRLIDEDKIPGCQRGEYSGFVNFESIWEKLMLEVRDDSYFPEKCSTPAKATIYAMKLDGGVGSDILLKLDFGEPSETLYLVFKYIHRQNNSKWSLLGSIPYEYGAPFIPPSQTVITDGKHYWLVIGYSSGHGAAFGSTAVDWYEVSEDGVKKVLFYQSGLYVGLNNPIIESNAEVIRCDYRDGITNVVLQFSTSYKGYDGLNSEGYTLWTSIWKETYIKGPGMQEFTLDPFHSHKAEEYDPLDDGDIDLNKDFLKYNYVELEKIATRGNRKQKEWLRDFLDTWNDCPEKQSLQKALEGARP